MSIPSVYKSIRGYKELFLLLTCIVLTLFAGLASSRGDYISYKTLFEEDPFENNSIEIGFQSIFYFFKHIGSSYHLTLIIIAVIAVSCKLFAFIELTPYAGLAIVAYIGCFFVPADMGSIRFGWAMSFFLLSLKYIKTHEFGKFSCIILFGTLFHTATIFAFLLYLICSFSINAKYYIVILLLSYISFLYLDIAKFIAFLQNFIPDKYNIFIKALSYIDEKVVLNFAIIKRIGIFIIVTIFYKKINLSLPYLKILYNAYFLSIVLFLALSVSYTVANRTSWLFASVEPVLLSGLVKISDINIIKGCIIIGIFLYSLVNICHIVTTQTDTFNLYLPYKLFFL